MTPEELDKQAREVLSDMIQPLVEAGEPDPLSTLTLSLVKMMLRAGLLSNVKEGE